MPSLTTEPSTTTPTMGGTTEAFSETVSTTTQATLSSDRPSSTSTASTTTTTRRYCDEMQYISTLIALEAVKTLPEDIPNKQDLITTGVHFIDETPSFFIDLPKGGAIIRDIDLFSSNVAEIKVTLTTEAGRQTAPIRGEPTQLPTTEFPDEPISEILIKITETKNKEAPKDVTLSVIACAEGLPTVTFTSRLPSTSAADKTESTTEATVPTTILPSSTMSGASTTIKFCDEMEYIQTLIDTGSVNTYPKDIPNKQDLITNGVDFVDQTPSFIINIPKGGAVIRDIDVSSPNIAEITVTFTTESGREVGPIRGTPTSLPTDEFPAEKVIDIIIKMTKTTDYRPPQDVTLSVTACAEGTTTTTTIGTKKSTTRIYEMTGEQTTSELPLTTGTKTGRQETTLLNEETTRSTSTINSSSGTRPTTTKYCDEMEYIQTLIDTDSVKTSPIDIPNKGDLVKEGVDFTDQTPSFIIDVPKGGAIIRDLDVISANVAEITVVFTTQSGEKVGPIRGAPTTLPTEEFPKEKVDEIVIKVTKTTDYRPPQDVILSVTACAEGITTTRGTVV